MNALTIILTVLFIIGLVAGILRPNSKKRTISQARSQRCIPREDPRRLDDVDEMFLWGEVNGDDFYR